MREIVFRGKAKDRRPCYASRNGQWIEGSYIHRTKFWGDPVDDHFIIEGGEFDLFDDIEALEVDPATVGQFIGLYDAAGKRIFEGDIVRTSDKDGTAYPTSQPSIVKYDEYNCSCCNGVYGWTFAGGTADIRDDRYVVVVGNIYDNPELLEENVRNSFFYG